MKAADGVQIAERWAKAYAAAKAKESEHGWAGEPWACILVTAIEELSAAEERERVLRGALNRIKAAVGTSTEAWHIANAALTAAPEQPDRSVCPDCKSTTRSFRGRRGDEHGEWVCDNEWHAPEQGKEAKS